MRKQFYKIKQFNECISLDFHWSMLAVKHNAMLIVIHIRRILESPRSTSGFYIPCRGNCFWIFFRFGQIDGNINLTVWTVYLPLLILLYTIPADIIAVLTQLIKIISSFLRAFCIFVPEFFLYLTRTWHQTVHQSGIK